MKVWHQFLQNIKLRRYCVLLFLILILYLFRDMMNTILLTFIFTLLVTRLVQAIRKRIRIPAPILVIIIYLLIIFGIVALVVNYIPVIAHQAVIATNSVLDFYQNQVPDDKTAKWVLNYVDKYKSSIMTGLKTSIDTIVDYISNIGSVGISVFMSVLLSFFFTLEENQLAKFSKQFLNSEFGWFFQDVLHFAKIFIKTFGVVLEAQFFIAICNTIITTVVMGFMKMPQLAILSLMVFFLSLVPVAGVIISLIPLSIIGYSVGGFQYIIYLVIMIAVVHALEAYVLNPKFMSSKTELPIFYTFIVLLIGEKIFGGWGLIVSVPVFTFFLDILDVHKLKK
ncbi:AI-2E family transporter [Philodulcilactobacillus myokoensis]|uniref:AI-2E family transporter n=1 Tax=Philodulcilactobacillus myokoensis TaxID=2929573 RepID=A0A9W6B1U9_9LACO|nr:AI-2E family transporter [Philodulcilactobacillus myokoensis]GLB47246.1 AI-2E family transporter [Philodulcilactobacillus myokoensis]